MTPRTATGRGTAVGYRRFPTRTRPATPSRHGGRGTEGERRRCRTSWRRTRTTDRTSRPSSSTPPAARTRPPPPSPSSTSSSTGPRTPSRPSAPDPRNAWCGAARTPSRPSSPSTPPARPRSSRFPSRTASTPRRWRTSSTTPTPPSSSSTPSRPRSSSRSATGSPRCGPWWCSAAPSPPASTVGTTASPANPTPSGPPRPPTPPGELARADVSSMRSLVANAAPVPYALKQEVIEKLGDGFLYEVYGSTELGVATVLRPEDQLRKPGSCGQPYGNIEIRIVGDDGHDAPTGQPGELYIRTRLAMDGYHRTDERL